MKTVEQYFSIVDVRIEELKRKRDMVNQQIKNLKAGKKDNSRNERGLVIRTDPPKYLGAVVLCQGADSSVVRLAVIDAVSKVTGLGTDRICVLKMK